MRIMIETGCALPPHVLQDRVRLALGSRIQAVRAIRVHVGAEDAGVHLRITLHDGRRCSLEAWHADPAQALDQALKRLRRVLLRAGPGISRRPGAPPC
jgi:ribosome-associated translation inhibitor RaiA